MNDSLSAQIRLMGVLIGMAAALCLSGCDYARMYDDEAVDVYKMELPEMPDRSVQFGDPNPLALKDAESLENPLPQSEAVITEGKTRYKYYCEHCHGLNGRGYGTVGQSFGPLPTDLTDDYVQEQSDGNLFLRISNGFLRHPPMGYTVMPEDRWAIIRYIRTLPGSESRYIR